MIRFTTFISLFGLLSLVSACNPQTEKEKVDYKTAFLVDVRTPDEFAEGTVPGAVNIPLQEIDHRIAEFQGKKQIVVFCRSGSRSTQAKSLLEQAGVTNIINGGTWEQVRDDAENQL